MASTYMTPGVYIQELNAFPNSAVAVETAVPVFIGYTETAAFNGNSLQNQPTRITSFAEYIERFGPDLTNPYKPIYKIVETAAGATADISFNGGKWSIEVEDATTLYMYNSIRMFYANGGAICYILSVGTYQGKTNFTVNPGDFQASAANPVSPFDLLKKEYEPTLVVMPDAAALGAAAYPLYVEALMHCSEVQSRFAIIDVKQQAATEQTDAVVEEFRTAIGVNNLNYGAAYYPWLNSALIQADEVDADNLDLGAVQLADFLPEPIAKKVIAKYNVDKVAADTALTTAQTELTAAGKDADKITQANTDIQTAQTLVSNTKKSYLQALKAVSPTYNAVLNKVLTLMNQLPPSGAMAGLYTMVDNDRGVWKAPANVSVNMVNAPSVNISAEGQQNLNVDVMAGKSINVIRSFPGIGTLVWGGRTLDGNSQDWRYINVRRTLIMIEQSLKLAARAYVFEPNDANTWITVKSMFDNFLVNLWKQGALAGAVPEQAFDVQIGLGSTMTGNDILDGKMLVTVKVAIVRPAEFIVITFQQQMQQS